MLRWLANLFCSADWIVFEDAWGDIDWGRGGVALGDSETVLRWGLRKGEARRIAREMRRARRYPAGTVLS